MRDLRVHVQEVLGMASKLFVRRTFVAKKSARIGWYGTRIFDIYDGASPFNAFHVNRRSLKLILSRTGSQCKSFKIGVMWSNFRVFVRVRAATFGASWSLRREWSVRPVRRDIREVIRAWIIVAALSFDKIFLILLIFLLEYTVRSAEFGLFQIWSVNCGHYLKQE